MANRTSTISLEISDKFSQPLNRFIQEMKDSTNATRASGDALKDTEAKMQAAAAAAEAQAQAQIRTTSAADQHSSKLAKLSTALGITHRESHILVGELTSLAGVSGEAGAVIQSLAGGLGPAAIVTSGLALALKISSDNAKAFSAAQRELISVQLAASKSIDQVTDALLAQKVARDGALYNTVVQREEYRALAQAEHDEALAKLEGLGNAARAADYAKKLTEETTAAGLAMYHAGDAANFAGNYIRSFAGDMDALGAAVLAANGYLSAFGETANNIRAAGQKDIWQTQIENIRNFVAEQDKAEQKRQQVADAIQRDAERIAKTNAELNKQFKEEGAAAVAVYGDKAAAAFNMIASSALSAADKVRVLQMWEGKLPANIRQSIQVYIATHGDALLMKLFGGMGGPGGGKGNQQGDEWNFNLEGEDFATRAAYMNMYHDYGRANEAWERDHRDELRDKGVTGPGQPNTDTGETYKYAMGVHEMVNSPRSMMVGERGPERVDVTPGGGGGGGNIITINWSSLITPSAYETQQLARRLKQAMDNDGG